jgi:hypothetical protein
MNYPRLTHTLVPAFVLLALCPLAGAGDDPATLELRRLQLQRAQQQNELQLRMQQRQQSVLTPPSTVSERLRQNELEMSQQWRQQQLQRDQLQREQALRAIPGASDPASQHQLEIQRAEREGREQLQRFRSESEAAAPRGGAATRPDDSSGAR